MHVIYSSNSNSKQEKKKIVNVRGRETQTYTIIKQNTSDTENDRCIKVKDRKQMKVIALLS